MNLRERALNARDDQKNEICNERAVLLTRMLGHWLDIAAHKISHGRAEDPDGDLIIYAEVEGLRFGVTASEAGAPNPPLTLVRICECGYAVGIGDIRSLGDLGRALETPAYTAEGCLHEDGDELTFEGTIEELGGLPALASGLAYVVDLEAEDALPAGTTRHVALAETEALSAQLAALTPGAAYRFALFAADDLSDAG